MNVDPQRLELALEQWEAAIERGERPSCKEICDGDPELASALRRQIEALQRLAPYLELPEETADENISRPQSIGSYTVIAELARGGMGIVYRCRQVNPGREVAVKVMHPGRATDESRRRFQLECEILAMFNHPGIARVYEAGITDFGHGPQPYFAMELIDGQPLDAYADQCELAPRQRVRLLQLVCEAVGHAHENGVIHRDLKPSNILVDKCGQPKIVDFGIARLAEHQGDPITAADSAHAWLGTLPYTSPEQLQGGHHTADVRSDVYSLGVIAFQLLTGRLPFEIEGRTVPQIIAAISQQPLPRLSVFDPALRGDLEAIVLKAVSPEIDTRYETARAFHDDLGRYLNNRQTVARPTGKLALAYRWCNRNRTAAVLATLAVVALIAGSAASSWFAIHARRSLTDLQSAHTELAHQREIADSKRSDAETSAALADERARRLERSVFNARLVQIGELTQRSPTDALRMLDDERLCPPQLRGFTWHLLRRYSERNRLTIETRSELTELAASPNGRYVAALETGNVLRVWDARTGLSLAKRVGASLGSRCLAFSPDSRFLAAARDQTAVFVYETTNFEAVHELRGHSSKLIDAEFSGDGSLLATCDIDGTVFVWDVAQDLKQRAVFTATESPLINASFLPNSTELLTVSQRLEVNRWDADKGALLSSKAHAANKTNLARVSRSEGILVTKRAPDEFVKVRDADDGDMIWAFASRNRLVHALAAHGEWVAVGTRDGFVELWSVRTRQREALFKGHHDRITQLRFAEQGNVLVSAGADHRIRFWSVQTEMSDVLHRAHVRFQTLAQDQTSNFLAAASTNGVVTVHDTATPTSFLLREMEMGRSACISLSPNGELIAGTKPPRGVEIRHVESGNVVAELETDTKGASSLLFTPNSQTLLLGGRNGMIRLWDLAADQLNSELIGHTGEVLSLALSSDGRMLASGSRDGTARVWDLSSGSSTLKLVGHEGWVTAVAISPDGRSLASSGRDRVVCIWDAVTGRLSRTLEGHNDYVESIAFCPDGLTLASASSDHTVRLWDPVSGDLQAVLTEHTGAVRSVLFSFDGATLISAGADGTIRSWDTQSQQHGARASAARDRGGTPPS